MAYQALYRTWRPLRFDEVVGQDHITKVLSGQISLGKTSHAYLFAGPRGTGKTSLAKIFAGAINCTETEGAKPCGKCISCMSDSIDIIEIDAASNNGVDSVREIRDRVNLLPALCNYKVYIIDEAHMLTKGAFNALLKTLEEPPPHVIFILATTEPHKLLPTIRSRCQRFDFRRIPVDIITVLLTKIADAEALTFDDAALRMIARAAEGGMRDALSILDQCVTFGEINITTVASALGGTDISKVLELTEYIAKYDEKNALETLRDILDSGADTRALIGDLADIFRRMMWLAAGADIEADESLLALAKTYGKAACVRALDILLQKEYEMRQNLRSNIVLETAVMALMCPEDDTESASSVRIEKLEGRLKTLEQEGLAVKTLPADAPIAEAPKAAVKTNPAPAKQPKSKPATPKPVESDRTTDAFWERLLSNLKQDAYFVFTHAKLAKQAMIVGTILEIIFDSDDDFSADFLKGKLAQTALKEKMEAINPDLLSVSIITHTQAKPADDTDVLKMFGGNIEQI